MAAPSTIFIRRLKKVSDGDLTIEVHSKRNDEFQLLAEGICDMIAHMKEAGIRLKDVNEELSQAATDMSAASSHFLATSQDIQNQVGEMRQVSKNWMKALKDMPAADGLSVRHHRQRILTF